MGTDIHMFAEYRRGNTGEWVLDKTHKINQNGFVEELFADGRNYCFFSMLAGVRKRIGDGFPQIYDRRGVPNDLNPNLLESCLNYGGHSSTWLTLHEYKKVVEWALMKGALQEDEDFVKLIEYLEDVMDRSSAEAILLDEPSLKFVECRIFMYFDS